MGSANRNDFTPYANTSLQALIQHVRLSAHAVLMLRPVFTPVIVPSSLLQDKTYFDHHLLYKCFVSNTHIVHISGKSRPGWYKVKRLSLCKTLAESLFLLPSIGVSSQFTECKMRLSSFFNSFMKKNLT